LKPEYLRNILLNIKKSNPKKNRQKTLTPNQKTLSGRKHDFSAQKPLQKVSAIESKLKKSVG